nr:unnamed protein product [Spirometra erinaceieuropaei]
MKGGDMETSRNSEEDGGDASAASQLSHSPQRAANQREWASTASGRELPVPGQHALPQHQDRRRSRQQDLESQSSLRSPPKHSLESSWSPTEHKAEDVQGRHPADATVRSGDLDGVHEAGTSTKPLPPQLSPPHPEAELAGPHPRHRSAGILSIYSMLRQMQLRWSGHLVRMDDERLPKRLFYGDVATGSRRQGGQIRRYKDTLKSSLKRLHINPTNWEELARDRPTWRRTVKTGAAIYEANRIAAAKVKREVRKSQLRPIRNAAAQPLPTCPRCQRTFRARIGLVGHLRTNCTSRTAPAIVPAPASSSSSLPPTNSDTPSAPPLPSSSFSSTAPAVAVQAAVSHIANHDTATATTPACPHCDRTFTLHNGLVGHLRIHRTESGEPVPGAPTYTHRTRLHCPHCPRTFTHRMGLFGHMRIHESGIDRNSDTATTSNTPRPILAPPSHAPTATTATTNTTASSTADTDTADLSCPHCPCTFTSRIGLVGHLRIHRTETGEPVPGAPTYTHRTRLHCPHCPRTFTHRMGLFGHMRIHNDLR